MVKKKKKKKITNLEHLVILKDVLYSIADIYLCVRKVNTALCFYTVDLLQALLVPQRKHQI